MKTALRFLAAALLLGALAWWTVAGANRGWTKTSVPIKTLDEVTGIEAIAYQDRFVPGVDFLGAAGLMAGALAAVSLFLRKPESNPTTTPTA